jgi:hypothetical protein
MTTYLGMHVVKCSPSTTALKTMRNVLITPCDEWPWSSRSVPALHRMQCSPLTRSRLRDASVCHEQETGGREAWTALSWKHDVADSPTSTCPTRPSFGNVVWNMIWISMAIHMLPEAPWK